MSEAGIEIIEPTSSTDDAYRDHLADIFASIELVALELIPELVIEGPDGREINITKDNATQTDEALTQAIRETYPRLGPFTNQVESKIGAVVSGLYVTSKFNKGKRLF